MNYSSLPPVPTREFVDENNYSHLPGSGVRPGRQAVMRRKQCSGDDDDGSGGGGDLSAPTDGDSVVVRRVAPPPPRTPPRPKPRSSLKKSRSSETSDVDCSAIYAVPYDSVSETENQRELRDRGSRLLALDLDVLSSRDELLAHVTQLKHVITSQTKELARVNTALHLKTKDYEKQLQEKQELLEQQQELLEQKEEQLLEQRSLLQQEQDATANAVNKVVYLQTELQRYITKHGSTISESG